MATSNENLQRQLYLLLIIFGSAALVLALYHIIKVTWYDRRYQMRHIHRPTFFSERGLTPESLEHSMAELIPVHKFQKGVGLIGEDGPCAVCLCDFEEGEELRTLPECMHSFHVPCIDMWFYSHSTCPICRTDAMPSANASRCVSGDGLGSPPSVHGPRLQPDLGLHSEAV